MVEIYFFGGVGDCFGLVDDEMGECLLVVMLFYCGCMLLEGLICDF